MSLRSVWVLTQEHNDYNQYGDYFIEVWATKPSYAQLASVGVEEHRWDWVLGGGGRQKTEDNWYNLIERKL